MADWSTLENFVSLLVNDKSCFAMDKLEIYTYSKHTILA